MRSIFILIALFAISLCSYAEEFKAVPMSSAFLPSQAQPSADSKLPFQFAVPSNFEKREVLEQQTVLWGTKQDIETVINTRSFLKIKNGVFSLKISLNAGYNQEAKKFSGEDQLASLKNESGFSDVSFQRFDSQGFPMTTFTAIKDGRHLYLHYIALGSAALLINYFPSEPFSERDTEVWLQFIKNIKTSN